MSYDKNTISFSAIDAVVDVLKDMGIGYKLTVIAKPRAMGLNDDWAGREYLELRRLEYGDVVYLEQIEQDADCDTDDTISSQKFKLSEEPKDWQAVVATDKTGQYSKDVEDGR